jgi:uncharacterized membrane protein YwzB
MSLAVGLFMMNFGNALIFICIAYLMYQRTKPEKVVKKKRKSNSKKR